MTQRILTEAEMEAIYDAERDGSAYVKPEPDPAPANPSDQLPDIPYGQLADGTPIMAEYDTDNTRFGVVNVQAGGWRILVDDSGHVSMGGGGTDIEIEVAQLRSIGALVAAGAFDRLHAAAVAWEHGQPAPEPDGYTLAAEAGAFGPQAQPVPDVEIEVARECDAVLTVYRAGYAAGRLGAIRQIQAFMDNLPNPE